MPLRVATPRLTPMSENQHSGFSGSEPIRLFNAAPPTTVLHFWRWALSDVTSNTARGLLAEFLVACDLGVTCSVRKEWTSFDLKSRTGIRVEVKASGYVQRWAQKRPTSPSFSITSTRLWDEDRGVYAGDIKRQADVFVFCLHAHRDRATLDPFDVRQWKFFVAPTTLLDMRLPARKRAALTTLQSIGVEEVSFGRIDAAISKFMDPVHVPIQIPGIP